MIISFSASVTGINTLLSKKFAWKINDLCAENLLDPVLNYTERANLFKCEVGRTKFLQPSKTTCEARRRMFQSQERSRKQFSPLYLSCEARAGLFTCEESLFTAVTGPPRWLNLL